MFYNNFTKILLLSIFISSSAMPMNKEWVVPGTMLGGVGGGAAAYLISSGLEANQAVKIISTIASTAGCGFLTHWLLYRITPQGRYERAMQTINSATWDDFVMLKLSADDEYKSLKQHCKTNYESDWYLVSGKMRLNRLKNDLVWAWSTLDLAQQEAGCHLAGLCKDGKYQSDVLRTKVLHLLDLIDSDSAEYHRQRKAYDSHLERQQREQHHSDDRYDRWNDRSDRRYEKQQDRKLKKELHNEKMAAKGSKLFEPSKWDLYDWYDIKF
jgi:hypothetical protein